MKFGIDAIEHDGQIHGKLFSYIPIYGVDGYAYGKNYGKQDIPLGTEFTNIRKFIYDSESFEATDMGIVLQVNLILTEVEWYRKIIGVVPIGHSARMKLEGTGVMEISRILDSLERYESVTIET